MKTLLLFQVIYYRLTRKNHIIYLTNSQYSICILKEYSCLKQVPQSEHSPPSCKTPGFFFLLIFLVSSPPSTNTLRFPHSSRMNTILSKSYKFLYHYHLVLPWLSQFFLKDCPLQLKREFLCKWNWKDRVFITYK